MPANATVFLPSEAALEALGEEGREALRQDKYFFVTFIVIPMMITTLVLMIIKVF